MAKNLVKRLGKGLAIAGASALAYLPMNSDADHIGVRINSDGIDSVGSEMFISHKSGGEEGLDYSSGDDSLWHNKDPPSSPNNQDKWLRVYSNQLVELNGSSWEGWEMNTDNRGLTSREDFPLRFDAIAKESVDEGIFSSNGNYLDFRLIDNWNSDGSGIQDYAYELKIWGNNDESNPYFTESTASTGDGIRNLMDYNDGKIHGTFDLSSIQALTDGADSSVGGPDYGSLTLTPKENIIPEPTTGLLTLLGAAGLATGGRKRHSRKNRK